MKVSELKPGMLITTTGSWEVIDSMWKGRKEGKQFPVQGITVRNKWGGIFNNDRNRDILLFVGTTDNDFQWGGVKKHHNFLWNGKGVIMTGYDVRYFEELVNE